MKKQSQIGTRKSQILIVGAGPAGTSLAIRLAQKDFEVVLIERETFPRHKLCGEFISPECLMHFADLGVLDKILSAGGERITETRFYEPGGHSLVVPSKWFGGHGYALSLSRAEMDLHLLDRARSVGVKILEDTSVTEILSGKNGIYGIKARVGHEKTIDISAELFVDATGRSRVLSKLSGKHGSSQKSRVTGPKPLYVGFKTHLKYANLEKERCEIYSFRGGYGGLSPIEGGVANLCFLIRASIAREFNGNADKIIEDVIFKNNRARATLKYAEPVRDWLAVSIDSFGARDLNPALNLFSVGDSAAFIDPFTGSGMLMALESAELLAESIASPHLSKEMISETYRLKYKQKFERRLRVCSLLRHMAFVPNLARFTIFALGLSESSREILARLTRPRFPIDE